MEIIKEGAQTSNLGCSHCFISHDPSLRISLTHKSCDYWPASFYLISKISCQVFNFKPYFISQVISPVISQLLVIMSHLFFFLGCYCVHSIFTDDDLFSTQVQFDCSFSAPFPSHFYYSYFSSKRVKLRFICSWF